MQFIYPTKNIYIHYKNGQDFCHELRFSFNFHDFFVISFKIPKYFLLPIKNLVMLNSKTFQWL